MARPTLFWSIDLYCQIYQYKKRFHLLSLSIFFYHHSLLVAPKIEEMFMYKPHEYVSATEGVVPEECDEVCIITPGADLNSVLQPDSVKDMVLARMDRMTLNEQTVLKCASVLG